MPKKKKEKVRKSAKITTYINNIKNSDSTEVQIENYDKLLSFILAPIIFLSSFMVLIYDYFEKGRIYLDTYVEFAVFVALAVVFMMLLTVKMNAKLRHNLTAITSSLVLLVGVLRFYYVVGPAMWTFAFILIVLSIAQDSKVMIGYISVTILLLIGHASFNQSDLVFKVNIYYDVTQVVFFIVLIAVSRIIFNINRHKAIKLKTQLERLNNEIIKRKEAEEKSKHMALYDQLTGLPNRRLFADRLHQALELSMRNKLELYVLFIDIDMFKLINDTLGHHSGDNLLMQIGDRLTEVLRGSDAICRVSGDEFLIMLFDIKNTKYVKKAAERLIKSINTPFDLDGNLVTVSCSIGISSFPEDGSDVNSLIKRADIAMYKAKQAGKNRYEIYSSKFEEERHREMKTISAIQSALANDEFILHYQPQVDGNTNEIVGYEALIRWMHPTRGLLSPDEFILAAEKSGVIIPIGEWVIKTACRQNKAWQDSGMKPVPVAVNISIRQINNYDLYSLVKDALEESGLKPEYLELEITETILAAEAQAMKKNLGKIRELGVKITIDDFGTGYSAIQYLKHFPIDRIKIPKNFIHGIDRDSKDESIINVILTLAENLKLDVIAEGVETEAQYDFLMSRLCSNIQGYMFYKPMEASEIENFSLSRKKEKEYK